ncbi:hypothetical protein Hanom_Chr07g00624801 [Helianthus anomalus]
MNFRQLTDNKKFLAFVDVNIHDLKDILDAHVFVSGSNKKKMVLNAIAQVVIWGVWRLRNGILFGRESPNITKVVEETKSMAYHWIKNRSGSYSWSWEDWRKFKLSM